MFSKCFASKSYIQSRSGLRSQGSFVNSWDNETSTTVDKNLLPVTIEIKYGFFFLFGKHFIKFQKDVISINLAVFTENKYPNSPKTKKIKYPKTVIRK